MTRLSMTVAAAAIFLIGTAASAEAGTIALQSFSGGVLTTGINDQLFGWKFDVLTAIDVTALGVGATNSDGLAISHDVGIFRVSDQALLTSAIVPNGTGGVLDAGFRYVSLESAELLTPGSYVIMMTMPTQNSDFQSLLNTTVVTAPEIAYVTLEFDVGSVLAYPNPAFEGMNGEGIFGPNFEFTDAQSVPEPTSITLAVLGFLSLIGWYRLRKGAHPLDVYPGCRKAKTP